MQRNFLLLILVLVISFTTASFFGEWYDKFSPQYGSVFLGTDKNSAVSFVGFFVSYLFFVILLFSILGSGNKKRWIWILLIPTVLLWVVADLSHIYLPILLGLIAFALTTILQKLFKRNSPQIQ